MVCNTLTGSAQMVLLGRLDRAMRNELDDKMLGHVGSSQLTGIKLLRRAMRWHEQEVCFSWAGGRRHITELVVLSGRMDIRAVAKTRTLESKATDGGVYAVGSQEAIQAVAVLDGCDCQYAVPAARGATTEPATLDWMRVMRLARSLTADDELEWLSHEQDVHLIEFGCAAEHVISLSIGKTMLCGTSGVAELGWLWTQDIGAAHKGECVAKCKEKDLPMNQDAEAVSHHHHWKGYHRRDRKVLERDKDRKGVNAALMPRVAGGTTLVTPRGTRSRWTIGYSQQASTSTKKWRDRSNKRRWMTEVQFRSVHSDMRLRCQLGFADQVKGSLEMHDQVIQKLCKVNRQLRREALERCAEDAGALRIEHARMFNH